MTANLLPIDLAKLHWADWFSRRSFALSRVQVSLFAAWVLSMIGLPIAKYVWGETALTRGVVTGVILQALLVLSLMHSAWGAARTFQTVAIVSILTWLVEAVGTATGLPFGVYEYSALLQPQIAHVPLLIPLAWLMMFPAAWAVAYRVVGKWQGVSFVAVSALSMTAWDLFLDPQMVAWGLWTWAKPGGYFGIPWQNYLGWLLAAALITVAVRPHELPTGPFMLIYVVTWLLEAIGLLFFWGLPGPALVGFVGMGSLIWLARQQRRN
jgi:putative membrane protein